MTDMVDLLILDMEGHATLDMADLAIADMAAEETALPFANSRLGKDNRASTIHNLCYV